MPTEALGNPALDPGTEREVEKLEKIQMKSGVNCFKVATYCILFSFIFKSGISIEFCQRPMKIITVFFFLDILACEL